MRIVHLTIVLAVATPAVASAQLLAARDNSITYGHHHFNVSDPAAHQRLSVDALVGRGRLLMLTRGLAAID